MFAAIGRFCVRRRRVVVVAWLLLLAAGLAAGGPVFAALESGRASDDLESVQALDLIADNATYGERVLGLVDEVRVADPVVRAEIEAAVRDIALVRGVARVLDPYAAGARLVATDGRGGLVVVDLERDLGRAVREAAIDGVSLRLRELPRRIPGASVEMGGGPLINEAVNAQVEADTKRAELISLPITLVVMVVIFGGLVAALLPLIGAIAAVAGAFLCLLGFSLFLTLDPNIVPVVTLLGLGISIDYALLIVSRFREERAAGADVPDAVERTAASAGRTITFSALTVAVSLSSLLLFDDPTFRAIGAAGGAVVVVALLAGLTLVPALLAIWGGRVPFHRGLAPADGAFSRLARWVQRRAWPVAVLSAAALLVAGVPLLSIRLQNGGADLLPADVEAVQVEQNLAARFPGVPTVQPVTVLAEASPERLDAYVASLAGRIPAGDVAAVEPASRLGDSPYSQVNLTPAGTSQGEAAQRLVRELRAERPEFRSWVTGDAAILLDFTASLVGTLPWAFALVSVAAFVLLFLMTGSVLVPLKALVMNTVSLAATFGALVWVFQEGNLEGLLGFTSPGAIETWVPVLVFAFAFGVSMDYEVFLLARIKELYDAGMPNDEAVRVGLQRSGRIITSAALLIVIVFAGFAAGRMLGIKELGFALAVAVVVDATLVRCLLVPATMTLLGDANWWAPAPLRRLHARVGLHEGGPAPVPAGAGVPAGAPVPVGAPAGGTAGGTAEGTEGGTEGGTAAGRHRAGRDGEVRVTRDGGGKPVLRVRPADPGTPER